LADPIQTSYNINADANASPLGNPTLAFNNGIAAIKSLATPVQLNSLQNPQAVINQQNGYGILRFPPDGGVYYMSLMISAYQRPSMLVPVTLQSTATICLPVPANLTDATSIQFNTVSRNVAVAAILESQAMGGPGGPGIEGTLLTATQGGLSTVVGGGGSAAAQALGQASNPFLTVIFESPAFKEHSFIWKFSPKNAQESTTVKQIINTLKYHQLPGLGAGGGAFLTYPDLFQPVLYPNSDSLYLFAPCVLKDCVVNYAPAGKPAFFQGTQAPAEIELKLTFMEVQLWMKNYYPTQNVVF